MRERLIDLEIYVSTDTAARQDFDIVEKVEMVSARRCDAYSTFIDCHGRR